MAQRASLTPVLPGEFEDLIPDGQASLCEVIIAFLKFELRYYKWHKYAFPNGSMSDNFKAEICHVAKFCGDPQVKNPESPFYEPTEE